MPVVYPVQGCNIKIPVTKEGDYCSIVIPKDDPAESGQAEKDTRSESP